MLDDLKYIHQKDAQDALGIAEKLGEQLTYTYDKLNIDLKQPIENVVIAGMGGSALAASVIAQWPARMCGLNVPITVNRDYYIPPYVSKNTLFIASSYSGNTEETLSALSIAARPDLHDARIVIVTSGGKLADIAKEKGYPLVTLPPNYQPRMTFGYQLKALVTIFEAAGLFDNDCNTQSANLEHAAAFVNQAVQQWRPDVPTKDNLAKQVAQELMGKSPVVYAGPMLFPAAYKWKISFNENAKNVAWCNQIPEFNHNEFMGWTSHPTEKPYAVIDLRSNLEHPRVQKRFEVTERLLSGKRPAPIVVDAQGEDELQQLLWTVALGDFVSLYLALLNGLNPTPVDLLEKFKQALTE